MKHSLVKILNLFTAPESWPQRKSTLVALGNTRVGTQESSATSSMALYDRHRDFNHGPTNWYLWIKSFADLRLVEAAELGGGLGLGLDRVIGGGRDVYRVIDHDLHFSKSIPSLAYRNFVFVALL